MDGEFTVIPAHDKEWSPFEAGRVTTTSSEGAGTGAISGAAWSMLDADREKQQVVKRCVAGRGYRVLN